jgi:hypothetical protein
MLKLHKSDVPSGLVLPVALDGARVLSFSSVGSMLSAIDAELDNCVFYLRLFALVQHMGKHREFPSKTDVTLGSADPHAIAQLQKHGVTEEMLMYMDSPFTYCHTLGVKSSVLTAIKEAVVEKRRGLCCVHVVRTDVADTAFLVPFE